MAAGTGLRFIAKLLTTGVALVLTGCGAGKAEPSPAPTPQSSYMEGAKAYRQGDRKRAIAALEAAVKEKPDLIMAWILLGNAYRASEKYELAAARYEQVVKLDPWVAKNHYNLGLMYQLLNRLQEAARSYLNALRLEPEDFRTNMNLGLVYAFLGEPEKGLIYSQAATRIRPDNAEAWSNLGAVLDDLKRRGDAENAYRRSIELDSTRVETQANLAANLLAQGKHREAAAAYEIVLRRMDHPQLRLRYGFSLLGSQKLAEAEDQFRLVLIREPRNAAALAGLGDVAIAQYDAGSKLDDSKRKAAVTFWKQSLAINPNQSRVLDLVKRHDKTDLFAP